MLRIIKSFNAILFVVVICGPSSTEGQEPVWDDLMSIAWEAQQRGDRETEAEYLEKAVLAAERTFGPEDARLALTLNSLATSLYVQGRLLDAEAPALRAWQISKKVYGEKHLETISYKLMVGQTYLDQGRLSEAESIFTENFSTLQDLSTENMSSTLQGLPNQNQQIEITLGYVYTNLGRLYAAQMKYIRAAEMLRNGLELLINRFGNSHPLVTAVQQVYEQVQRDGPEILKYPVIVHKGPNDEKLAVELKKQGYQVVSEEREYNPAHAEQWMIVLRPDLPVHLAIQVLKLIRKQMPQYRYIVSREYADGTPGLERSFALAIGIQLYKEEVSRAQPLKHDDWDRILEEGLTDAEFRNRLSEFDWR